MLEAKYQKNIDIANKVIIPKRFVDKHGKQLYMEVYEDKIILIPKKQKEN